MSDENEEIYVSALRKQLSPNVFIQARINSIGEKPDLKPALSTLLKIESAILAGLKKNDKFLNVESISDVTGEPIYNFSNNPLPGDPVLQAPILVVSTQTMEALEGAGMVSAPRVYPSERLCDEIHYIDDGITEEDSRYVF